MLCNVSAATVTKEVEEDPSSLLQWDMPIALKAHLIDIAQERRLPIEEVCRDFLAWKLARPAIRRWPTSAASATASTATRACVAGLCVSRFRLIVGEHIVRAGNRDCAHHA